MRQLHPVAFHEQFLASGTYIYEQDGQRDGAVETWTIHRLPDQSQLIRIDFDARQIPLGISILTEVLRDSSGSIQRFDIHFVNPYGATIQRGKATFVVYENHVEIGRQLNDQPRQSHEIAIPANTMIYPLMHIFTGQAIGQLAERGGHNIPVFVPDLTDLDSDHAINGMILIYSASYAGNESINWSGKSTSAKHYRFTVGSLAVQSNVWVDSKTVMLIYEDQTLRIRLKDYARNNNE